MTYWDNWYRAFALGPPTPLSHAWSLSIEEQFYVVWPVVLLLLLRAGRYRLALWLALAGGVASSVVRAVAYHGPASYDRVYFSTDTRASDLLFGCALALLLAIGLPRVGKRILRVLAGPAIAVCCVFLTYAGRIDTPLLYRGGLLVFGVATAVVLGNLVVRPVLVLSSMLAWGPVVYVGRISYALYLWLRPVEWFVQTELGPHGTMAVGLVLTFVLASVSRIVIEQPFLRLKRRYAHRRVEAPLQAATPAAL